MMAMLTSRPDPMVRSFALPATVGTDFPGLAAAARGRGTRYKDGSA